MSAAPRAQRNLSGSERMRVGRMPHSSGSSRLQSILFYQVHTRKDDLILLLSRVHSKDMPVMIPLSRFWYNILRSLSRPSTLTFRCNFKKPLLASPTAVMTALLHIRHNRGPPPRTLFLRFGRKCFTSERT